MLDGVPSHVTVGAWLNRGDWPFRSAPPWPLSIIHEIEDWRIATLEPDRNTDQQEKKRRKSEPMLPMLGAHRLSGRDMLDESCPFRLMKATPQSLIDKLTLAELNEIAGAINFMTAMSLVELVKKTGEGDGLPSEAPAAYWQRLMTNLGSDQSLCEKWMDELNRVVTGWLHHKFKKNTADNAALVKFWDETFGEVAS
jgi:hypothetical protein